MSNATKYQQSQKEITIQLIKDAIKHIMGLGGIINQSTVARATQDIADKSKNQKGLTPGAISKNDIYRDLVNNATEMSSNPMQPKSLKDYAQADIRIQLGALRVKYSMIKDENKIMKSKLESYKEETLSNSQNAINTTSVDDNTLLFKHALKDIVKSLLIEDVCYIDKDDGSLKLSVYESLLLDEVILQKLGLTGDY